MRVEPFYLQLRPAALYANNRPQRRYNVSVEGRIFRRNVTHNRIKTAALDRTRKIWLHAQRPYAWRHMPRFSYVGIRQMRRYLAKGTG